MLETESTQRKNNAELFFKVNIPARITVEQILNDYVKSKATKSSNSKANAREAAAGDIAKGFIEYFNVMLGSQLLYKFETEQHAEIVKSRKDVPMSQVYRKSKNHLESSV